MKEIIKHISIGSYVSGAVIVGVILSFTTTDPLKEAIYQIWVQGTIVVILFYLKTNFSIINP